MMEEVLYGCDVMPSAVHITSATLSGVQPDVTFNKSRIYTMPYGRQPDGTVSIGSLELLQPSQVLTLFNTNDPALRTGSVGEETAAQINVDIPDGGFDLVIMNPPFTSNTAKEAANIGVFAPAFAAFNASDKDQRDMAKKMAILKQETSYHGHAGMASAFAALAHRKLKPGGILALVLPLTASAASSWRPFRGMLESDYSDASVLSIAANGADMSFSADTGIAECLVVARKNQDKDVSGCLISLRHRPHGHAEASVVANMVIGLDSIRGIQDGPYGGSPILVGDELVGETVAATLPDGGKSWGGVRILDYSLAQTAFALAQSRLWLPGDLNALELKTTTLESLGELGLYDLDIIGKPPQGPFDKLPYAPAATYPSLWNHDAKKETRLVCEPDSQLQARIGMETKAALVWATASQSHFSRDFRFTSQPLAVAVSEHKTIGGRAWPNVRLYDSRFDYPFSLWANSTLGLLFYWWSASRQQDGRGVISINAAKSLPILDFRTLSDGQLATAEDIFNDFRDRELKPAYLADADPNRAHLDRRIVCDLLGFDENIYEGVRRLAAKWCAEPSVHGGKARPKNAKLVM